MSGPRKFEKDFGGILYETLQMYNAEREKVLAIINASALALLFSRMIAGQGVSCRQWPMIFSTYASWSLATPKAKHDSLSRLNPAPQILTRHPKSKLDLPWNPFKSHNGFYAKSS